MIGTRSIPAVLLSLLALAGCSMDKPGPSGPVASSTQGKPGVFKIAGMGFQNDQFFKIAEFGMKDAASKNGVELSLANSAGSLEKELSLIDTYTAGKVNAIVMAPSNPKSSVSALKRAHDAGITVVTYDSSIEADFPASTIKSDQIALGKATGEEAVKYIKDKMGGKAKVAIITYESLLPIPSGERNKGFIDEVRKLPGVEIVAKQDAWMADKAISVVDGVLAAHPEVNLIWAANEGGTVGAVTAVRNAGKAGKIVVFGTDMSDQMGGFLLSDDNVLQAVTGQKPFDIASGAIETAVKALKGEKVDKMVLLPGQLFTRTKPDEVKKYQEYLRSITGK